MKKHFATVLVIAASMGAALTLAAATADDPVLMTINGKDIRLSEFNYLYNKNNSQQVEPQTLDEYVDMFVNYKLKVAAAEEAGIDTTRTFRDEYGKFISELSAPYFRDEEVAEQLVQDAYTHYLTDRRVSHIMLDAGGRRSQTMADAMVRADSIRSAILNGEISFEDAAARYSIDRGSSLRGGYMGYVTPGRLPYAFEKVAYDTPLGGISEPVFSGYGVHIVRVESVEPAAGEVTVEHILRLTRGRDEAGVEAQRKTIDSLYQLLLDGASFGDLAMRYSEDPGSARNGGALEPFAHGAMVEEFDSVSFALADGEISRPFTTAYGFHIVHRTRHYPVASFEQLRPTIESQIQGDERSRVPERARLNQFIEKYNSHILNDQLDELRNRIAAHAGGYDSTMRAILSKDQTPVVMVDGRTWTIADVMPIVPTTAATGADNARHLLSTSATRLMEQRTLDRAREDLAAENADFRNLINEYRDGLLLFDISNANVWERAATDNEGLAKYFAKHRADYKWDAPRYKAYVFFCNSDSVLNLALDYAAELKAAGNNDITGALRERFGRDVKVERVIAAQGENAITDYLGFGADKPAPDQGGSRWAAYAAFDGRIIDQPEEVADVRGLVITDYQTELENQWVKALRKKYKFKVNRKVLNTLR